MRPRTLFASLLSVSTLLVAACGSDEKSDSTTAPTAAPTTAAAPTTTAAGTPTTAAPTTAAPTTTDPADFKLDKPVKIVNLVPQPGQDPLGNQGWVDGPQLAVDEINKAGGIGGHPVELVQKNITSNDPAKAQAEFLDAVDEDPVAIIGMHSSNLVTPLVPTIDESKTLVLTLPSSPALFGAGNGSGSEWLFPVPPQLEAAIPGWMKYAIDTYKPKKVGYLCVKSAVGDSSCATAIPVLKAAGIEVVEQHNEPTATDLTDNVLAFKGVDMVFTTNFPGPGSVFLNQLLDNGIDVPVMTVLVGAFIVGSKAVRPEAVDNVIAADFCAAAIWDDPAAKAVRDLYKTEMGKDGLPTYVGDTYTAAKYILEAVIAAQSTDHDKVREAMYTVEFDSPCGKMQADKQNALGRSAFLYDFDPTTFAFKTVISEVDIPAAK